MTQRPTRTLLRAGLVANLLVIALWAVTRTWGLPGGLMPAREPIGPWDAACAVWEVIVVACCLSLLSRRTSYPRTAPWFDWHGAATAWFVVSALSLALLSLGGAGS